ncbi:MAG: hypothetical protein ACJAXK_002578 [Yoonia sp.]|jgi:hypothetical protein
MDNKSPIKKHRSEAEIREDRLKASLKANMAKRKAQTRARAADKDKEMKE